MARLLHIEDDARTAQSLEEGLTDAGYEVVRAETLAEARRKLEEESIDLILLDLGLPDGDGFSFLEDLSKASTSLPVMILSARDAVPDRVRGLENGAVDYLTKPFALPELVARLRLRLQDRDPETYWKLGSLRVELLGRRVWLNGNETELPPREFDLLVCLLRANQQPVSREQIGQQVWRSPKRMSSLDNLIDVHISRLRENLKQEGAPRLRTLRGIGFVLEEAE